MIGLTIQSPDAAEADKFYESAQNIAAHTRFGVEHALWRSGKDVLSEFNRQVLDKNSKTGRIYIRRIKGGARRKHQASAPFETPANRTGNYRKSVGFSVDGAHQLTIGNRAEYAGHLEVGTSRMAKRPGLGNAIAASERSIIRNLATDIEDAI